MLDYLLVEGKSHPAENACAGDAISHARANLKMQKYGRIEPPPAPYTFPQRYGLNGGNGERAPPRIAYKQTPPDPTAQQKITARLAGIDLSQHRKESTRRD